MDVQTTAAPERVLFRHSDLSRLIDPKVIAVVGASPTPGAFGQRTLENLADFPGAVYGINPKYDEVMGRPCFPSIADLPEVPDALIVGVGQAFVAQTLEDAAAAGVGGAILYASGYAETGEPENIQAQQEIAELAQRTGLRVAGPNCVGLANLGTRAIMNFMTDCGEVTRGAAGGIGIVSQSGALGYTVLQAVQRGVGISHYLAAGNSADVDVCDYIAYLAEDPAAKAIVCLMEGVKSGERFLEAARLAQRSGTPLIVYKAGNSEAAGKAALSHTGTLSGSTAAYRAAVEEAGAIWVEDLEALTEVASFFVKNPTPPRTAGVGIMATSGGAGVINADKAEEHGLTLPPLSPETVATLETIVPSFGSVGNPADLTAEVLKDPETFVRCLDAFTSDPMLGALLVPLVFAHEATTGARAKVLCEAARHTDIPLVAVWMNDWLEGPGSHTLDADPRAAIFRSADRAAWTIRQWQHWHERRANSGGAPARISDPGARAIAEGILRSAHSGEAADGRRVLSESDSKAILAAYGIRVPGEKLAATPADAADAADAIGYPVVLKIASADIAHKSDVGGIRLDLGSREEVVAAATEILESVPRKVPDATIDGVSVQTQIASGPELLLGARIDAQFGPIVTIGMGGVLVEVLRDATIELAPFSASTARRGLERLRGFALLEGVRGDTSYDIDAAADAAGRFSELVADLADVLDEVDVNPLIVGKNGATAADGLVVTQVRTAALVG
ncbi:acetate--CoA ligase family protein [Microbacterium sp. NPDC096154]|uniref:acetate--CoA ligase family protein n=1 Tax=Microbacterium sp. NPDC096154 TaxID=3155549 RepID=UPI0033338852